MDVLHSLSLQYNDPDGLRWLSGQGVWLFNQKVAGSIPSCANDAVSLGKALHPTCLGDNVPVLTVSHSG